MPPAPRQAIPIPFGQGLETKQDPKQVPMGKLLALENGVFSGPAGIMKRNGFKRLNKKGVLSGGNSLATFGDELLLIGQHASAGGPRLSTYSPALDSDTDLGSLRAPSISTAGLYADNNSQASGDCATLHGVTLYAYEPTTAAGSPGVTYLVKDEASGALIKSPASVSGIGSKPRVVAAGGLLFVFYLEISGNALKYQTLSAANPTGALSAVVTVNSVMRNWYSVQVEPNTGDLVVVYYDSSNNVQMRAVSKRGVLDSFGGSDFSGVSPMLVSGAGAGVTALAVACLASTNSTPTIGVFWGDSANTLQRAIYTGALHQSIAPGAASAAQSTAIANITAAGGLTQFQVFFEVSAGTGNPTYNARVRKSTVTVSSGAFSESAVFRSVGLATDAVGMDPIAVPGTSITAASSVLVGVVYDDGTGGQSTVYFVDGAGAVVGKALVGRSAGLPGGAAGTSPYLPHLSQNADGVWLCCLGAKNPSVAQAGTAVLTTQSLVRVSLDFSMERFRSAQLGGNAHISGGVVQSYAGLQLFEQGFHVFPEQPTASTGNWDFNTTSYPAIDGKGQQVRITPPADDYTTLPVTRSGSRIRAGSYLVIYDSQSTSSPRRLVLYFTVDGAGSDPTSGWTSVIIGHNTIVVPLNSTDDQQRVCQAIAGALVQNVLAGHHPAMVPSVVSTGTDPNSGLASYAVNIHTEDLSHSTPIPLPVDDSAFGMGVYVFGGSTIAEVTAFVCPAAKWIQAGQWFLLESSYTPLDTSKVNETLLFYFKVDGSGSAPSVLPAGVTRTQAVSINSTDAAQAVAVALSVAIAAPASSYDTTKLWATVTDGAFVEATCHIDNDATHYGTVFHTAQQGVRNGNVGGDIGAGRRLYYAIYEWTDASGEFHRSAPSKPLTALFGNMDDPGDGIPNAGADPYRTTHRSALISVPTLRLTRRPGSTVKIGLFRTQAAAGPLSGTIPAFRVATLANDTTVDSVSFVDTLKDADITSAEVLYTCSGELPNGPPPSSGPLTQYGGRLWAVNAENPVELWFSKPLVSDYAPAFGLLGLTSLLVEAEGGAVTALAAMDSSLVIFKQSRIYLLSGDGPDAADNGSWQGPTLVNTDVGCENPESIAFTAQGLLFQSAKGIYLLDRSGSVSYVGAPVEKHGQQSITSAILKPGTTEIVFTSDDDTTLLYDYFYGQWGTFTNHLAAAATLWAGGYVYLRADGTLMQEADTSDDDGLPVQLLVKTAWIKPAGAQGSALLYSASILGTYVDPHRLNVGFAFDYVDDMVSESYFGAGAAFSTNAYGKGVYGNASPFGGGDGDCAQYQFQAFPSQLECEAVQITIWDTPQVGGSEGLTLSDLTLDVGIVAPIYRRLGTRRRVGQS